MAARPNAPRVDPPADRTARLLKAFRPISVLIALIGGLFLGYRIWGTGTSASADHAPTPSGIETSLDALRDQVNPPGGYGLGIRYGDLGPRLLSAGVIDLDALSALYQQAGLLLSDDEMRIWREGTSDEIIIDAANSRFVLNFLWAVGLANRNAILTEGPMQQYSEGQIDRFASTGGWTLAARPITEIYASLDLVSLTPAQQTRLEQVASAVFRPCCDNPTHFPDCNHGMAMLGLLELLAAQDATPARMFAAAKYANAYWFPTQALETALYLKTSRNIDFQAADGRLLTGKALASGSGFAGLHQELQVSGLLPQQPGGSGSCAN